MLNIQQADEIEFRQASAFHDQGRVGEAEKLCKAILGRNPQHIGALHLLGILLFTRGQVAAALPLVEKVTQVRPSADAYSNLAEMRRQMGDLQGALTLCEKAILLAPDFAPAHLHKSLAYFGLAQFEQSLAAAKRAVECGPNWSRSWAHYGAVLGQVKRYPEAIQALEKAIALDPRDTTSMMNIANIYRESEQFDKAVAVCRKALAADPQSPMLWVHLGTSLAQSKQLDEARVWLEKGASVLPESPDLCQNLGSLYVETRDFDRAYELAAKGVKLAPERQLMWVLLQKACTALGRFDEAEVAIEKALALGEKGSIWKGAAHNRSIAAQYEKSLEAAEHAIRVDPKAPVHHFDRGLLLLTLGRWEEGWKEYEWRRELKEIKNNLPPLVGKEWTGEPLNGKSILLYTEQGHGDTIQFVRFASLVAQRGGKVVIQCETALKRLLQRAPGVAKTYDVVSIPPYDFHCPLLSLGHVFNINEQTIPRNTPYLEPYSENLDKWKDRLAAEPAALKVGLSWAGRNTHASDHLRTMDASLLVPLLSVPGVRFYSLQKSLPPEKVAPLKNAGMVDYTDALHDFADTAALIANLDLVISVDTAVAHLAGALNIPTWILLATYTDWRWQPKREDSPWYPSMRLFRQATFRDWPEVIGRVKTELERLAAPK